jgi:hypothetical protein
VARNQVIVSITGNAKGLQSALGESESALSKFGKFAAGIGAAAAIGLAAIGVKAVNSASELEQAMGGMQSVFKESSGQMEKWADAAANSVGLAKSEYATLATVLGSQLKNMGVSTDALSGQTDSLVGLGADLAAQFGGSTSDAVSALSSLLRGERDPIERYGVSINEAAVKAKMAEMGLEGLSGEAEKNAKLQATLALLTEQTADAQGAFARESDTLAGSQQRLNANLENLWATLGTALLPIVADATQAFTGFITEVSKSDEFQGLLVMLQKVGAAIPVVIDNIVKGTTAVIDWIAANKDWLTALGIVAGVIATVITAVNLFKAVQLGLIAATYGVQGAMLVTGTAAKVYAALMNAQAIATNIAAGAQRAFYVVMALNPIGLIITAIVALVAGLIWFFTQTELGQTIIREFWNFLQEAWTNIVQFVTEALTNIGTFFVDTWENISSFFEDVWKGITDFLEGALKFVVDLFLNWTVYGLIIKNWENILNFFRAIPGWISSIFNAAIKWLTQAGVNIVTGLYNGVTNFWNTVVGFFTGLPGAIGGFFAGAWNWLVSAGSNIIQGLLNGLRNAAGAVGNFLVNMIKNAVGGVLSFLGIHSPSRLFASIGKNTVLGLVKGLDQNAFRVDKSMDALSASVATGFNAELATPDMAFASGSGSYSGVTQVAPVYNVHVNTLNANAETGRVIVEAIKDFENVGGRQ